MFFFQSYEVLVILLFKRETSFVALVIMLDMKQVPATLICRAVFWFIYMFFLIIFKIIFKYSNWLGGVNSKKIVIY